ncbi:MAG: hypothetical protein H6740_08460 [Alphaproteobacteria bacterium]|nr:hypothetical protein [Alphaproteobacteria bacterium]
MSIVLSPPVQDRRLAVSLITLCMLAGLSLGAASPLRASGEEGPGCGKIGLGLGAGGALVGVKALSRAGREGAEVALKQGDNLARHADDLARQGDALSGAHKIEGGVAVSAGQAAAEAGARALDGETAMKLLVEEGPGLLLDAASYALDKEGEIDSGNPHDPEALLEWSDGMPASIAKAELVDGQVTCRVFSKDPFTLMVFATKEGVPLVDFAAPDPKRLSVAPVAGPGNVTVPAPEGGDAIVAVVVDVNADGRLRLKSPPVQVRSPRKKKR